MLFRSNRHRLVPDKDEGLELLLGDTIAEPEWKAHWVGMPAFDQRKVAPYKALTVRFSSEEDYAAFADLIGQKLTPKTKSIWVPAMVRGINRDKVYRDEP